MEKMFIVKYDGGSYDDYYEVGIFVTDDKSKATKYCTKFNKMLKKWSKHYEQYEEDRHGMTVIKDEFVEEHFDRWCRLKDINRCYCEEIDLR